MSSTILLIGGGAREQAIACYLARSPLVTSVHVAPGNAGVYSLPKIDNVDLDIENHTSVINWCKENNISLVVVGPEKPLADGLADYLNAAGIACFGPTSKAARLESSKEFAKAFMQRNDIPTARWKSFKSPDEAKRHIAECSYQALVVKASGLAAGKGVIVASNRADACEAVDLIVKEFGTAAETIIVEELLCGEEVSILAFSDGFDIAVMPPAKDHKRLLDGDKGPNTGGMGAFAPCKLVEPSVLQFIEMTIVQRTIDAMNAEGHPFVGVLYVGLMITDNGPMVLEYNCRFGDPEAEVILPLLTSDLYLTMRACVDGSLRTARPEWDLDIYAVGVVLATAKYPNCGEKGCIITDVDTVMSLPDTMVFQAATTVMNGMLVTNGGRVLVIVVKDQNILTAAENARIAAGLVKFEGVQYRTDIGHQFCREDLEKLTYTSAGVDVGEGDRFVQLIQPLAQMTCRPGVIGSLGGFGGVFDLKAIADYTDPLIVSGADGVGTKLKLAQDAQYHATVGIDLVAMCVNDILTHGAQPLFFLDYFATAHLDVNVAREVVVGVADGCTRAQCALLGGETAEMPGMYTSGEYDLAGFAVGVVERTHFLPRKDLIRDGDILIGIASSGLHSNGFSLVRKILDLNDLNMMSGTPFKMDSTLGSELLRPTKIYVASVLPILRSKSGVNAVVHITGGGLSGNLPRVLPDDKAVVLDARTWSIPPVFGWLAHHGISDDEMLKTFNCGIGMVLVVTKESAHDVLKMLNESGENCWAIGNVISKVGNARVEVRHLRQALTASFTAMPLTEKGESSKKKRVAVIISGTGTNLQALIDSTKAPLSAAEIVLVISNIPQVPGLERARKANIPTKVINHKEYKTRLEFDNAVHECLTMAKVDFVCLAGFMRILTGDFVRRWTGRLINIHPSLLPSFPGIDVHKRVLKAGVRVSGCTVHFVEEKVDTGAIIAQEAVVVDPHDDEHTLAERVKLAEHKTYPRALQAVARGYATLIEDEVHWK